MLTSRILALALFASYFTRFVFVVVGIHFAASYAMLWRQECEYFEGEPMKQRFFRCAIAYVHVFCFFPLDGKNTRKWGYPYYILILIENVVMVLWWTLVTDYSLKFRVAMLATEWGTFLIGVVALVLYYRSFHPSLNSTETDRDETDGGRHSPLKLIYKRARWETRKDNNSRLTSSIVNIGAFDNDSRGTGSDVSSLWKGGIRQSIITWAVCGRDEFISQ